MQYRIFWFPLMILLLALPTNSRVSADEFRTDMTLSALEYAAADNPRAVNEWARQAFATLDRSKAPGQWVRVLATIFLASDRLGEDPGVTAARYKKELEDALPMARQIRAWQEYDIFQSLNNQLKFGHNFDALLVEDLKHLNFLFKTATVDVALIRLSRIADRLGQEGRKAAARKYANQAKLILKENKEISDFRRQSIHGSIALALMDDPAAQAGADELFEEVTQFLKKTGRRHLLAQTAYRYGANIIFQDKPASAKLQKTIAYLEMSIAAAQEIKDNNISGLSRALMAHALNHQRKYDEAERVALEAIDFLRDDHNLGTLSASVAAGTAGLELKKYEQARINLTRAEELSKEIPATPLYLRVQLMKSLSQVAFALQNFDKAFRYHIEYYYLDSEWSRQTKKTSFTPPKSELKGNSSPVNEEDAPTPSDASWVMWFSVVLSLGCLGMALRMNRRIAQLKTESETQTLRRSFPPKLVEEFMLGRATLNESSYSSLVTVLSVELVDFGAISDRLDAERVTRLLNQYAERMASIIFNHEGMLDKYTGQGFLVIFGVPHKVAGREQAIRALHCGIEMMQALKELSAGWKADFGVSITMRLGMTQGEAVIGSFGPERRKEYTVVGSTVNFAIALQEHAEPRQILLAESAARYCMDDCEHVGDLVAESGGRSHAVYAFPWELEKVDQTLDTAG